MRIYFLHHSAVAVELDKSLLVFDHYRQEGKGLSEGSVSDEDLRNAERVYVFASHAHSDHYNRRILEWAKVNPNVKYILDSTIGGADKRADAVTLSKGKTFEDGYIYVKEFGSTDMGGSFYVRCEGKSFFHAGDLNYWHWRDDGDEKYTRAMTKYFEKEMQDLKEGIESIDYAFFPVDSRMGSGYEEGPDIFIEAMKPRVFIPIHLNTFEDAEKYSRKHFEGTEVLAVHRNGELLIDQERDICSE